MAKLIQYDNTGVEDSGGTGQKARPGLYVAEVARCVVRETKSNGDPANDMEVALSVGPDYDWLFTYIGLGESAKWKVAEFTRALGLKEKGGFDPDKVKGKLLVVKVNADEYQGEYSPRAGKMFKAPPGSKLGEKVSFSANGNGNQADDYGTTDESANDHGTPPPGAVADICREDPDDPEIGSYDEWPDEDIAAEVEARKLTLAGGRGSVRAKGIKALREDDKASVLVKDEPEEDDGPGTTNGEDGPEDYEGWSHDELVAEYGARNFEEPIPNFRGRNSEARVDAAIREALIADDNDDSDPFSG